MLKFTPCFIQFLQFSAIYPAFWEGASLTRDLRVEQIKFYYSSLSGKANYLGSKKKYSEGGSHIFVHATLLSNFPTTEAPRIYMSSSAKNWYKELYAWLLANTHSSTPFGQASVPAGTPGTAFPKLFWPCKHHSYIFLTIN